MNSTFQFVALLLLLFSACSHAQDDLFALSLEDLLDVPISGATLFDETRNTVPASVTVFDRQQIRQLGMDTLAELANLVPGFQVLRSSEYSAYSVISSRGRRISNASAEVLLLIDGKRTRNIRLASLATFLEFPLSIVERVEFIRGPGSALHGSGAMMGVINVVTRSEQRELQLSAGNHGNAGATLMGQWSSEENFLDLLMDFRESDGQSFTVSDSFTGEPKKAKDPYHALHAAIKGGLGPLHGSVRIQEQHYNDFYTLGYVDPFSETLNRFTQADLDYTWQAGDFDSKTGIVMSDSLNESSIKVSEEGRFASVSEPPSDAAHLVKTIHEAEEYEFSHQTRWQTNKRNRYVVGALAVQSKLVRDEVLSNFNTGVSPIASYDTLAHRTSSYLVKDNSFYAVFGQWQYQMLDSAEITAGLRYDEYTDIDKGRLSPRLAWVQSLNDNNKLKFFYGEAFRVPNIHERGIRPNVLVVSNPNLKPETATTTELVWLGNAQHWLWSLGYFYNQFDDAIVQIMETEGELAGARVYRNGELDSSEGIEAELQYKRGGFSARLSATAILEIDDISYRESTEMSSLTLNYSHSRWNINANIIYRGDRGQSIQAQDSLDEYWMSNAKFQYQFGDWGGVEFVVKHLSNETVYYPAQGSGVPRGIPSRGREYAIKWLWSF